MRDMASTVPYLFDLRLLEVMNRDSIDGFSARTQLVNESVSAPWLKMNHQLLQEIVRHHGDIT